MADLPLFSDADWVRDRAIGMVWGAACGARVGHKPTSAWPSSDDVLLHLSESLIEHQQLVIDDVVRRLIRAWAERAGRPAVVQGLGATSHASTAAFVAGLAPICILRRTNRKAAQVEVAKLALQFSVGATNGEALELMSIFLRLAVLGQERSAALAPLHWVGDLRVNCVAAGQSLPVDTRRDLAAAVDQARTLALRRVSLTAAFTALSAIQAGQAAFILAGALIGALDGRGAFLNDLNLNRTNTPSARMERLVDGLLALEHSEAKAGKAS